MVWDYSAWSKRKKITVDGIGDSAPSNYQFKLDTITYDSDMKTDFSDLRFGDGAGGTLSYWIESKIDSTSAVVWVKIPTISNSAETEIYMYYGNSGASSESDIGNTFIFGDDLNYANETEMNTGGWTKVGTPTLTFSNDTISVSASSGGQFIYYDFTTIDNTNIWEIKAKAVTKGVVNLAFKTVNTGDGVTDANTDAWFGATAGSTYRWGGNHYDTSASITQDSNFHIYKLVHISGTSYAYEDNVQKGTYAWSPPTTQYLNLGGQTYISGTGEYVYDWVRVRQYNATEPTQSIGSEEDKPTDGPITNGIFFGSNF